MTAARVLIVDDAAALRSMLRAVLVEEGCEVVGELASGAAVAETVARLKPDVVCLDYNLPDTDGLTLLKDIHAASPAVAVLMITGNEAPDLEAAAAEAGAAGFIRKPFSAGRIAGELRQVQQTQRLLAEAQRPDGILAVKTARARAVVADDSASMRMLLKAILERCAVEVVGEAADGARAVDLVAQLRPGLVCLDIDMPVQDGLKALEAIRAAQPAAKVLMITGSARREAIVAAGRLGAHGYLLKPLQPAKVAEAIDKLLG